MDRPFLRVRRFNMATGTFEGQVIHFKNDDSSAITSPYFDMMRKKGKLCDMEICVISSSTGETIASFPTHKLILYKFPFFEEYILTWCREDEAKVVLTDLNKEAVELVIEYMYTGSVMVDLHLIANLWAVSSQFQLKSMSLHCIQTLINGLTIQNYWTIRQQTLATRCYRKDHLLQAITTFVHRNYVQILRQNQLSQLELEQMIFLLESHKGQVTEKSLFNCIMRWVSAQSGRGLHLQTLLCHLSMEKLMREDPQLVRVDWVVNSQDEPKEEIQHQHHQRSPPQHSPLPPPRKQSSDAVKEEEEKKEKEEERVEMKEQPLPAVPTTSKAAAASRALCEKRVEVSLHKLRESLLSKYARLTREPEFDVNEPKCEVLIYPLLTNKGHTRSLISYNFQTERRRVCHQGEVPRLLTSLIQANNHIYDIGGSMDVRPAETQAEFELKESTGLVELYTRGKLEPVENPIHSLLEPRKEFGLVELNGYLYAIGGSQGELIMNCVERLRLDGGISWEKCDYLNVPRSALDAVVFEGKIWAVGGNGSTSPKILSTELNSMEVFHGERGEWVRSRKSMSHGRAHHRVAQLNSLIYVVGGKVLKGTKHFRLKSVELFHPGREQWTECPQMNRARSDFGLVVSDGCLLAIGGDFNTEYETMERFDPRVGLWEALPWPASLDNSALFDSSILIEY